MPSSDAHQPQSVLDDCAVSTAAAITEKPSSILSTAIPASMTSPVRTEDSALGDSPSGRLSDSQANHVPISTVAMDASIVQQRKLSISQMGDAAVVHEVRSEIVNGHHHHHTNGNAVDIKMTHVEHSESISVGHKAAGDAPIPASVDPVQPRRPQTAPDAPILVDRRPSTTNSPLQQSESITENDSDFKKFRPSNASAHSITAKGNSRNNLNQRPPFFQTVPRSRESLNERPSPTSPKQSVGYRNVHSHSNIDLSETKPSPASFAVRPDRSQDIRLTHTSRSLSNIENTAPPTRIEMEEERQRQQQLQKARRKDEDKVVVGTKITEGHANYVLMYDMLTGIRHAVSRCVAKPARPLVSNDFKAKHKLAFDIMGNEMTPSSKYEFKFKDYAPWVFRNIREQFKIEAADYLMALTGKYVLSELGSPGKSGSFFYFSQDYRFIIKTIHHMEHKFLRYILVKYNDHIMKNPNTLLSRYYGLHRVKLPHGRKIHFVVMGNVFPPNKDVHETFDLKGSTVGREVSPDEIRQNPRVVKKDLNWLADKRQLLLGPTKTKALVEQMQRDVDFLMRMNIMDYSLLLGIHYLERGNSENIRDNLLSVFEPHATTELPNSGSRTTRAINMRKLLAQADPVQLGPSSSKLPDQSPTERSAFLFYSEHGGMQATTPQDEPAPEIYFIGIIDITTPYNIIKKVEHYWKSINYDKNLISAVSAKKYARRFLDFMFSKVVGSSPGSPKVTNSVLNYSAAEESSAAAVAAAPGVSGGEGASNGGNNGGIVANGNVGDGDAIEMSAVQPSLAGNAAPQTPTPNHSVHPQTQ